MKTITLDALRAAAETLKEKEYPEAIPHPEHGDSYGLFWDPTDGPTPDPADEDAWKHGWGLEEEHEFDNERARARAAIDELLVAAAAQLEAGPVQVFADRVARLPKDGECEECGRRYGDDDDEPGVCICGGTLYDLTNDTAYDTLCKLISDARHLTGYDPEQCEPEEAQSNEEAPMGPFDPLRYAFPEEKQP